MCVQIGSSPVAIVKQPARQMQIKAGTMHIAVLGCGFMGTALIEGLLRETNSPQDDELTFTACVRSQASADRLRQKFAQRPGVVQVVKGELAKAAARADIVMLGCQPQELTDLLHNHDHAGGDGNGLVEAMKHKLVIFLLAGISCQQLLDALLDASASATAGSTDQPRPFDIARVNPYVLFFFFFFFFFMLNPARAYILTTASSV
ncbi:hypothetical protein KC331_g6245 [Hortaea werneckii]|nr:hypothetical protein KC331_g6245 [Hortaea werneckii]